MKIKDIKQGILVKNIVAYVAVIQPEMSVYKYGRSLRVCKVIINDQTGSISLTLWNNQIDMIKVSDMIRIENAYVNEWQGQVELTLGKFGKLEVIE